jgi:hypothetical protein
MPDNGYINQPEQWNGDIRDNGGQRDVQYFFVSFMLNRVILT